MRGVKVPMAGPPVEIKGILETHYVAVVNHVTIIVGLIFTTVNLLRYTTHIYQ